MSQSQFSIFYTYYVNQDPSHLNLSLTSDRSHATDSFISLDMFSVIRRRRGKAIFKQKTERGEYFASYKTVDAKIIAAPFSLALFRPSVSRYPRNPASGITAWPHPAFPSVRISEMRKKTLQDGLEGCPVAGSQPQTGNDLPWDHPPLETETRRGNRVESVLPR